MTREIVLTRSDLNDLPDGWEVQGGPGVRVRFKGGADMHVRIQVTADTPHAREVLESLRPVRNPR